MLNKLLEGYGSFFALSHPASKFLIFIAAMLQPLSGLYGLLGGVSVLVSRRAMNFNSETERIETINGILLGMLLGSLYATDYRTILLTMCGGTLVVLSSAIVSDTVGKTLKVPLLGLPYALVSFILLPVAASLRLEPAMPAYAYNFAGLPTSAVSWLYPLGAMYFNGTAIGGLLVLSAFVLSSRYLALLAVASSGMCHYFLQILAVPDYSTLFMVAQMNGVLTACIIGALYATPSKRSLVVSIFAALFACTVSLCLSRLLWIFGLPVLALPFVLATYACMLAFNPHRGNAWTFFWLPVPMLPERSIEQIAVGKARGIDARSVSLRAPFEGNWQVYQGFSGEHTHKGVWQYAIDFLQIKEGRSFQNDGSAIDDYYAFGRAVLAPAFGTVVDMRSDLPDNPPGDVDTYNNWGNFVLIQLDSGACVMLAHLQRNSIKVDLHARVSPGQTIALCGNSGRSPQPHLHVHVQESSTLGSKTLPFHFSSAVMTAPNSDDAQFGLRLIPGEGDSLEVAPRNPSLKRALRLVVGTQFQFEVTRANAPSMVSRLEVKLDLYGQFRLETAAGARVSFTSTEDFIAFYNRSGGNDDLLDAIVLAVGLTPLVEGEVSWSDAVPRRLLPMSPLSRLLLSFTRPLSACTASKYHRTWDSGLQLWVQTGEHNLGGHKWTTRAKLSEVNGLVGLTVQRGEQTLISARLIGYGMREDNGIPQQETELLAVV